MARTGPIAKIKEVKEIPLTQIEIGGAQVRIRDVDKDIDELAESIRKVGLIHPILVYQRDDGNYEVLTGQRRFLAHHKLGAKTILAGVLDRKVSEVEAKIISLTENLVRAEPVRTDYIEACTYLYKIYGSINDVASELGLSPSKVSEFVKYDRLIDPLKIIVDSDVTKLKTVLRAQEAATKPDGTVNEEEALTFYKEMDNQPDFKQKKMLEEAKKNPDAPLAQKIEEGRKQSRITRIDLLMGDDLVESLKRYAEDEGHQSSSDAAIDLITDSLDQKGYFKKVI